MSSLQVRRAGHAAGSIFMADSNNQVAELQGLYGLFTMAERVVQKIWLRGDFDLSRAVLADGRKLHVRSTGAWNLLGGPDFRGARLVIADREITGDVEVHFHATDWEAHRHAADRAYDNVVLHVVLFPLAPGERPALRGDGQEIPALVLLPLLYRDLEEYASDDALETITARDEWQHLAELAARPVAELQALFQRQAQERWRQKVHFAKLRIEKLGWAAAAHHTALEILGYRQNRTAMLAAAAHYPLEAWTGGVGPEAVFIAGGARWQLQGVRPANHPLTRLRQYERWVAAVPDWPERLLQVTREHLLADLRQSRTPRRSRLRSGAVLLSSRTPPLIIEGNQGLPSEVPSMKRAPALSSVERGARQGGVCRDSAMWETSVPDASLGVSIVTSTAQIRKQVELSGLRKKIAQQVLHNAVSGTRLDNLVCDGFLPLIAARTQNDCFALWFHWYLGDVPKQVRRTLPKLGVVDRRLQPLCHGYAQGLLAWFLAREARASC